MQLNEAQTIAESRRTSHSDTKLAVNVNDTVNVNDNVSVKKNSIDERKLKFAHTLQPFVSKFGKDMIKAFYLYWTEPNKSNTKFKQELEKTWSLERRLDTWALNDTKFSGKQTNETATVYKPSQKSKSSLDQLRAEEEAYQNQLRNAK
jgi:hypothetical protein